MVCQSSVSMSIGILSRLVQVRVMMSHARLKYDQWVACQNDGCSIRPHAHPKELIIVYNAIARTIRDWIPRTATDSLCMHMLCPNDYITDVHISRYCFVLVIDDHDQPSSARL